MTIPLAFNIQPLGDSALLIDFGNVIDEKINAHVLTLFHTLQDHAFEGLIEAVPAYSSLAVFYDPYMISKLHSPDTSVYEFVKQKIEHTLLQLSNEDPVPGRHFDIPVCYDVRYGPDIRETADQLGLSIHELIELHTERTYSVYMIGFLPGFPYMGEVDEQLIVARKSFPLTVVAGSVGLAGKQTGIYPLDSPGGWQIIGRTPISLFDKKNDDPVLLRAGDQVTFFSISPDEFEDYQGRNS